MLLSTPQSSDPVLLIFNPTSGLPDQSPDQLVQIIAELQANQMRPEVVLLQPEMDLSPIIRQALQRGIRMVVVSGGDGTVNTVAAELADSDASLGVIPTGTQNNVALSLGIPGDIAGAVGVLRHGQMARVDMGLASCDATRRPFLEVCSVGLLSALFPSADEIQHGRLSAIGDFFATLVSSPPAHMRLLLENNSPIDTEGHVVLVTNMPFIGPNYPISAAHSFVDGLLDVLLFSNLTKLELIGAAVQVASGEVDDPRIQRYQVRSLEVNTDPPMPILADGFLIGESPLRISVQPQVLSVMIPQPGQEQMTAGRFARNGGLPPPSRSPQP